MKGHFEVDYDVYKGHREVLIDISGWVPVSIKHKGRQRMTLGNTGNRPPTREEFTLFDEGRYAELLALLREARPDPVQLLTHRLKALGFTSTTVRGVSGQEALITLPLEVVNQLLDRLEEG